tara:strand:- start:438 stop:881 length:444 start_codon:yes stop_codon:yes gene_type:complete
MEAGRPDYGKVVDRVDHIVIKDPVFVVQPAGRARVLREGKKNVHAFVRGTWSTRGAHAQWLCTREGKRHRGRMVTYNPYKSDRFQTSAGQAVGRAKWASLTDLGELIVHSWATEVQPFYSVEREVDGVYSQEHYYRLRFTSADQQTT